jgi:hypothetical protein
MSRRLISDAVAKCLVVLLATLVRNKLIRPFELFFPRYSGTIMGRIVLYTMRHYLGRGHGLVCDNRFTSAKLFESLYRDHSTTAVGSLRLNAAEMPPDYSGLQVMRGRNRGEYALRQSGRLVLTAWKDTKTVCVLGTNVDPTTVGVNDGTVKRTVCGKKRNFPCPATTQTYVDTFKWVDTSNQLLSSLHVGRRCKFWHRYIFFHKLNQG